MKIKALMYYGQRNIQLSDFDMREPAADEVLIRVTDAGLCQTQVNEFIEGPYIINKTPHRMTDIAIPIIVGHEFGGIIEKVGNPENDSHMIGSQVAVLPLYSCKECSYCQNKWEHLCDDLVYYGLVGEHGGFAEYACVKKENLFFVQDRSLLTYIEPILVALHAGKKVENVKDKNICVLGAGAVGICVAAVFRDYFEGNVIINDTLPNRLERAKRAGYTTLNKDELPSNFDIVVDCAGNDSTSKASALTEGFQYVLKNGKLISIGTYFHPISLVPASLLVKEHKVFTAYLYNSQDVALLPEVIDSLKQDFSLFNTYIKLENIIEEGYFRAEVDRDSFTRLVVEP